MEGKYLSEKTFETFCKNQNTLIEILNHRMTKMESSVYSIRNDIFWLKKLLGVISTLMGGIFLAVILKGLLI